MTNLDLFASSAPTSPFDAIRRTRDDGSEYWSARDLMSAMQYDQWRNFETAIDRARTAAQNQGCRAEDHVAGASALGGNGLLAREISDWHLTRFGAYLVVMNGDPRKPEVAAAQQYFAIRTREAEVAAAPDLASLGARDILAIAQRLVEQEDRAQRAEVRAERSERVVRAIESNDGLTPTEFHKQYFSDVRATDFFERLYSLELLIDQRGARGRDAKGRIKNGRQHEHPAADGKAFFYLHGRLDKTGVRRESPRVRPGRPEVALVEFLASKGLPANITALTHTQQEIAS